MAKKKNKKNHQGEGGGRPPIYKTAEELQKRINDYFENGVTLKRVVVGPANNRKVELIPIPTITGLVLHCGFCDRASFYDLERQPKFSHTIKRARAGIAAIYEELLHTGNPTGAIFALKNFGWTDKQEIEHGLSDPLLEKYKELSAGDLNKKIEELARRILGAGGCKGEAEDNKPA